MNRRGFAMLSVLWLIAALAMLSAGALAMARTATLAGRNRVLLARAAWAREACAELLLSRVVMKLDSVELGRDSWCSVHIEDPSARLNLNLADPSQLRIALGSDSLADALLDWRDPDQLPRPSGAERSWYLGRHRVPPTNAAFASVDELLLVRGFEAANTALLHSLFTVHGRGTINVNAAPAMVLRSALDLPPETMDLILRRRSVGQGVVSLDQLVSFASPAARQSLLARYQELVQLCAFGPAELVAVVQGRAGAIPLVATTVITLVPLPERLAVIRRETD